MTAEDVETKGLAWDLRLSALCQEDAPRTIRFLSGAIMACGGYVLSRRFHPEGYAEIEFEFVRGGCVEIYTVLIASGLVLGRESHLRLTELCQCTKDLLATKWSEMARVELVVRASAGCALEGEGGADAVEDAA